MAKKKRLSEEESRANEQAAASEEPVGTESSRTEAAEEAVPEASEEAKQTEETEAALKAAQAKADEYLLLAQRTKADFENYRRRNENMRKEAFDDGTRAFAASLLPVIDNFERAVAAASESPDESLKNGVEMILRQLNEAFEKRGIQTIDPLGEKFDPNLENAVMQGTEEEGEPGTVCAVFQKGYQLEGTVIRHAMVKVVPE
jgi:Molecular chaperone GrpE (heat shock protein)